jgi:hypothetical protein
VNEEEKQELATKYYECWQDAEAYCLALETWVKAVGKRREAAESRAAQLEEALRKIRVHAASRWILETVDAALSRGPSEAPADKPWEPAMLQDKERCVHTYSKGPGVPWQRCVLKKDHYGWHAWEKVSEAPEKEGEDG